MHFLSCLPLLENVLLKEGIAIACGESIKIGEMFDLDSEKDNQRLVKLDNGSSGS